MALFRWAKMHSWWAIGDDALIKELSARRVDKFGRLSAKIAAMMIYIALCIESAGRSTNKVRVTYTRLSELTGVSRALVCDGIAVLKLMGVVTYTRDGRNNIYTIVPAEYGGWCKIPAKKMLDLDGVYIKPFKHFKLRTKVELHALKLFIYLASVRNNETEYSEASYETISEAIGISNTDIQAALTLLTVVGLIVRSSGELGDGDRAAPNGKVNPPTRYYLLDYKGFF
ncbi:MAG: hypothetical protein ACRCWB_05405 [Enterovibrio sp.]